MYPRTDQPQVEDIPFQPVGRKATVRAEIANMLLAEMSAGTIEAVIGRAPEFYGPGKTQSLTNTAVFDRIKKGERPTIPLDAHTRRSLIWTPDASRALGLLGNTPDAYGQTWHLPIDPNRLTYAEMVGNAAEVLGREISYRTVPAVVFKARRPVQPGGQGGQRGSSRATARTTSSTPPSSPPGSRTSRSRPTGRASPRS
ncbi:NAD-dependent epimerase/dehydratase family protein [Nocardioides convexus]|uniref:NAD-dependent epimerase/dehydratase family protein n=1 Tax=Nocardioides convexus TaxID=2712224 RepID=UPI0024189984|nr:NAD-dependent epimerase/dehydratase family protein [Nocardioides convexus]